MYWFEDPFLSTAGLLRLPLSLQQPQVVREDKRQRNKIKILCKSNL